MKWITPSLINITFASNRSDCTICTNEDDTCCGFEDDDIVIPINCSTVSTYPPLTPSSQSPDVYSGTAHYYISLFATSIVSSVLIKTQLTHTQHFTTSVPYTSNKVIPAASAVVGGIVMPLLVVLTSVIAISCILVVIHKKHSQMKAQKQNWWVNNNYMYVYTMIALLFLLNRNVNVDMTECEAYGKLHRGQQWENQQWWHIVQLMEHCRHCRMLSILNMKMSLQYNKLDDVHVSF